MVTNGSIYGKGSPHQGRREGRTIGHEQARLVEAAR